MDWLQRSFGTTVIVVIDPGLATLASSIQGVIFDVDGVLTNGQLIYSDDGHELKHFNVQDGASIKLLIEHNIAVGIITGRRSSMVARRARELGIQFVQQAADSKLNALDNLIDDGFPPDHLCAIGDDLQDLPLFDSPKVALAVTVPNGHPVVLERAHFITTRRGGDGVAVEIAQLILCAQNRWPY